MLDPADFPLPALRDDLQLCPTGRNPDGEPAWLIQDKVVNRFYRIGWFEFECLVRWAGQTPRRLQQAIAAETALHPEVEQILGFCQFLERHQLLRPNPQAVERLRLASEGKAWLTGRWWLHHYLFFRVPLLRPQARLQALASRLGWLFHPLTGWLVVGASLLGILLVLQQWDQFSHAVVESFSLDGLLSFALALALAKTLHEMGHALVATRQGVRVAHMGIAFVVLWPMLYTDTSESWKLAHSRQRLAIASAGILTELALAGLATLGWALCADGALRNGLLYLATTSWILSLALNASPFMRFDGYFILSDLLNFPNLHERASALARVAMRRRLLGLMEPWPEPFPASKRRLLITFAMVTWLYRLVLFLGIAVAVYLLFFKLLGILLFCVEISWFILLPVWREIKHWWQERAKVARPRRLWLGLILITLFTLLALPWHSEIKGSGVARAERQLPVFTPFPAQLDALRPTGPVKAGEPLLQLVDPDLAWKVQSNEQSIQSYGARLGGMVDDPLGLNEQTATKERLRVQYREASATRAEIARLKLQAPFDGLWLDVDPQWQPGQWLNSEQAVGILIDPDHWQLDAYVAADDVARLQLGSPVRFYPDGVPTPLLGTLVDIAPTRAGKIKYPMLSSHFGGPIATNNQGQDLVPTQTLFLVRVQLNQAPASLRETRGKVVLSGSERSLLGEAATQLASVLLRESGF
ncbi:HlyD family efflux transporter periplasmic adaptor subunit [Aeromonas rivuli]|uniref:HlyD family efflux transporter periplasmic adaptor subunit n=1 Tax=Aeromonas rivuli TaxID=648794 RepID=UPI001CCEAC09|nr:HlyD family efflux transporter periplasmic adaptor subunit [Aeromonas rivuli]UBO72956.1 HlyD family efflux transporter periplasmic adaptor subunit [Aeromonas rivuli]